MQSAEELDQQRLEAQRKKDAEMKQERADRARKNAELVAQQKVNLQPQLPLNPKLKVVIQFNGGIAINSETFSCLGCRTQQDVSPAVGSCTRSKS